MNSRFFLGLFGVLMFACASPEPIVDPSPDAPELIVTSLGCVGEVLVGDGSNWVIGRTEVVARAGQGDLLGVQIYERGRKASGASPATYKPYAYGLFDDWSKLQVGLSSEMEYRIVASLVEEGKTKIRFAYEGYAEPFSLGADKTAAINSEFIYSSSVQMAGLSSGASMTRSSDSGSDWKRYTRPSLMRYFAQVNDFEPAPEKPLNLQLKRMVFGIRLSAPDLTDGSIELAIEGGKPLVYDPQVSTTPAEAVYVLEGSASWADDGYKEAVVCKATWRKSDGSKVPLGSATGTVVQVARNCRFPFEISTQGSSSLVNFSFESPTWSDQPTVSI